MALRVAMMVGDGLVALLVFALVSVIRFRDGDPEALWAAIAIDPRVAAAGFAVLWVVVMWSMGLYRLTARWSLLTEARDIGKTTVVVLAITLSTLFLIRQPDVSRLFLALLFIVMPAVTLGGRAVLRGSFAALRSRGYDTRYMLVAGVGRLAQDFADRVEGHPGLGFEVIGHLEAPEEPERSVSRPILGSIEELADILHSRIVDEVAVCLPAQAAHYVEPVTGLAAGVGKTVRVPVDPSEDLPVTYQEEFDGFVVRSLIHDGQREVGLVIKRLLDIVASAIGLVILSPILLITAAAIVVRDGSPVLFRQVRIGLHGRPFTMLKFRTMVRDAEEHLDDIQHLNERSKVAFKATNDPRITPLGRWLRKSSIDELPQLWNVLTGRMSLVGPRPPLPTEVDAYDVWHRRRLSMKPGITGLWQVEARHEPDFDRWVEQDLVYIDGWTLWLDLKILAKTLPAVLTQGGR